MVLVLHPDAFHPQEHPLLCPARRETPRMIHDPVTGKLSIV